MIQGQISIFELLEQSTNSDRNCEDCWAWYWNRCTWGEMMVKTYPKCVNKDKWKIRDDVRERNSHEQT
jgi:hypothetical protein